MLLSQLFLVTISNYWLMMLVLFPPLIKNHNNIFLILLNIFGFLFISFQLLVFLMFSFVNFKEVGFTSTILSLHTCDKIIINIFLILLNTSGTRDLRTPVATPLQPPGTLCLVAIIGNLPKITLVGSTLRHLYPHK